MLTDEENDKLLNEMHTGMRDIKNRILVQFMESKLLDLFKTFEESGIKINTVTVERCEGKLINVHLITEE